MVRQVLENGVILPAEYSDDWYDDMTSNLTKLDDVIGSDSEKLSSSDVGAAALSNSYNDLDNLPTIPTKTSDLTNDSNFVDTSNAAVASGITSAKVTDYDTHIADTDIHVTASDKTTWNAVSSKANDSDVVHKSGDETVAGFKEFANIRVTNSIKAINLENTTTDLNNCYSDFASSDGSRAGNIQYYYCNTDSGTANISNLPEAKAFVLTSITTRLLSNSLYVKQILINSNSKTFVRYCSNSTWSSWTNETDSEYVHKSGDETIEGNKTFSKRTIFSTTSANGELALRQNAYDPATNGQSALSSTCSFAVTARTVTNGNFAQIGFYGAPGSTTTRLNCRYYTGASKSEETWVEYTVTGTSGSITGRSFKPGNNGLVDLGTNTNRWKDVNTYLVNGLTPSSLSLPSGNVSDVIDISSYLVNLGGTTNSYTVPANGWISITMNNCSGIQAYITGLWGHQIVRPTTGSVRFLMPVLKNKTVNILIFGGTIDYARFIPCQGNV